MEQAMSRIIRYGGHDHLPESQRNVAIHILLSDFPETYKIKLAEAEALRQQKDKDSEKDKSSSRETASQQKGFAKKVDKLEETTDIEIYENAKKQDVRNTHFLYALAEASIDCPIHFQNIDQSVKKDIHCRMCNPSDKPLFTHDIRADLKAIDPCDEVQEKKIKAKEILVDVSAVDGTALTEDSTASTEDGVVPQNMVKFYYTTDETGKKITIYQYDESLKLHIKLPINHKYYSAVYQAILDLSE
jgi:hypothetical protein